MLKASKYGNSSIPVKITNLELDKSLKNSKK